MKLWIRKRNELYVLKGRGIDIELTADEVRELMHSIEKNFKEHYLHSFIESMNEYANELDDILTKTKTNLTEELDKITQNYVANLD